MKYYHSHGGNNKPYFSHRIKVPERLPEGAFEWCQAYDDDDKPFRRFHVEWDNYGKGDKRHKGYVVIQFEWEEAAFMFKLRWL